MQRWVPINTSVRFLPSLALFSGLEPGPAVFNSSAWNTENYPLPKIYLDSTVPARCLFILNEGQGTEVKRLSVARRLSCGWTTFANPQNADGLRRSKTIDFVGWGEYDNSRLRGQQESGEEGLMGVSLLSDGLQGSLSKRQISTLPLPPPHTPIRQLKQRGTRGELWEGRQRWW